MVQPLLRCAILGKNRCHRPILDCARRREVIRLEVGKNPKRLVVAAVP
jgi:hypothetical protein